MRPLQRGLFTIALVAASGCDEPEPGPPCHGVCGPGTRCEAGLCVVDVAAVDSKEEPAPAKKGRRRTAKGSANGGDEAPSGSYVPVDDSNIPRHDPNKTVVLDANVGSERLDDTVVRGHLKRLEPAFDRCIGEAAAAGVTIGSGRVEFELGIEPTGRVSGVTAKASSAIESSRVVPCLRKVLFGHRFPTFDGAPMSVEYRFEIG